jgi:hypothetical protein
VFRNISKVFKNISKVFKNIAEEIAATLEYSLAYFRC